MHGPQSVLSSRDAITRFLFLEDPAEPVDLCLILGCPTISNMDPAIELYHAGLTPRLIISGHGPAIDGTPEWRVYREYALDKGVPETALLIESTATNTLENFTRSAALVEREVGWSNVETVAIATKPFHTRRALMTARRHWPDHLRIIFRPAREQEDLPAESWWQTEAGRGYVLAELRAIGAYALAGHLGGF